MRRGVWQNLPTRPGEKVPWKDACWLASVWECLARFDSDSLLRCFPAWMLCRCVVVIRAFTCSTFFAASVVVRSVRTRAPDEGEMLTGLVEDRRPVTMRSMTFRRLPRVPYTWTHFGCTSSPFRLCVGGGEHYAASANVRPTPSELNAAVSAEATSLGRGLWPLGGGQDT